MTPPVGGPVVEIAGYSRHQPLIVAGHQPRTVIAVPSNPPTGCGTDVPVIAEPPWTLSRKWRYETLSYGLL